MKILSNRLALVLAEYSELPSSVQKVIDGNNKKDINMKGVLRLYKCGTNIYTCYQNYLKNRN